MGTDLLKTVITTSGAMKCAVFYTLALACCLGLAFADWDALGYGSGYAGGYGGGYTYVPVSPYGGKSGGIGNDGLLALIGGLFLLMTIFGRNQNSDNIILLNTTLEG